MSKWLSVYAWLKPISIKPLTQYMSRLYRGLLQRFDAASPKTKLGVSVTLSIALHLMLFLLLMFNPKIGFLSRGTIGEGSIDGAGFMVDLVPIKEAQPSTSSAKTTLENPSQPEMSENETDNEADDQANNLAAIDETELSKVATSEKPKAQSEPDPPAESISGSGATGQSGQADTDLWAAIAPCWNRISNAQTLGATLTISFSEDGGLSAPPVIERAPTAQITEQSLQSEAKALAALAECGNYPMAKGRHDVSVVFPPPTIAPN